MDPGLKLDSSNIPKYCPQCQLNGVKSKVKKFRIDPSQSYRVIMCINSKAQCGIVKTAVTGKNCADACRLFYQLIFVLNCYLLSFKLLKPGQ